jgi:hypothetical protein
MYKALLSNFPVSKKIHDIAQFYHGCKHVARRALELRILVTKGYTKRDWCRLDELFRGMEQLYGEYCFVFIVIREVKDE